MAVFSGDKYKKASSDAIAFIKRQLDVNNFKCQITFDKEYDDSYSGDIVWGYVTGISVEEDPVSYTHLTLPTTSRV